MKNVSGKTARVSVDTQKGKGEKVEIKLPALSPLSPNKKMKDAPMPSKPAPIPIEGAKAKASPKSPSKPTARNSPTKLPSTIKAQPVESSPPPADEVCTPEEGKRPDATCGSVPTNIDRSASPTSENVRLDSEAGVKMEEGPSIFTADLTAGVAEPSPDDFAAAGAATVTEEAERLRKPNGNGMVTLIYEQYNELFPIEGGSTTQANIDEVYCLSFVMPNCLVRLSRHPNLERFQREENGIFDSLVREDPRGIYHNLEKDQAYYVVVEQEADQLRRDQEATKVLWDGELQKQKKADKDDGRGFETCSCIYGNPCVDEYGCRDWHSRFAVATTNGWKGF